MTAPPTSARPTHPRSEAFFAALQEIADIHVAKGADYGAPEDPFANITVSEKWGIPAWQGAIMRGTDKVVRLQAYVRNGTLANEGAEDALLDLAAYAIIALVLFRERAASRRPDPQATAAPEKDHDPEAEGRPHWREPAAYR